MLTSKLVKMNYIYIYLFAQFKLSIKINESMIETIKREECMQICTGFITVRKHAVPICKILLAWIFRPFNYITGLQSSN